MKKDKKNNLKNTDKFFCATAYTILNLSSFSYKNFCLPKKFCLLSKEKCCISSFIRIMTTFNKSSQKCIPGSKSNGYILARFLPESYKIAISSARILQDNHFSARILQDSNFSARILKDNRFPVRIL